MNSMSPELLYAIQLSEASRARMEAHSKSRSEDRRVAAVAIEHEDRRKGPRRMSEVRALLRGKEKD